MQLALRADADRSFWSAPSPSTPRDKRLLLAGVAIAGASVIAINPVAPTLPAVQDRAVELAAWIDPIGVVGETVTNTVENVGTRGNEFFTDGLPAAWEIISNSSLYTEIAEAVFNPFPGLEQFFTNLPTYAATIGAGLEEANAGLTDHFAQLPVALEEAWDFVLQGQFTQAFAKVASWGIFGLGYSAWPLAPAFEIPGQIARDFGAPTVATVLDALFVGDTTTTGYAYSLLGPPLTAIYQLTDIMNVISGSLYEGDWVTAVSEVINAPAKVLNAFLNGYQASISPEWETFPGIFSEGGPIDAFFVQLPKTIAAALAAASEEDSETESTETTETTESTETTNDELPQVSSTELAADGELVAVNVSAESPEEGAEEAETVPAGDEVPVTAEDEVTEEESEEDATPAGEVDESTEAEADEDAAEGAEDEAGDDSAADESDASDDAADAADSDDDKSTDSRKSGDKKSDGKSDNKSESSTSGSAKSDSSESDSKSGSDKSDSDK